MLFNTQTMQEILPILQKRVKNEDSFSFSVLNPDTTSSYAGTTIEIDNQNYIYRGWKAWVDLAELLQCKMLIPKEKIYPLVELTFQKLEKKSSFHLNLQEDKKEKYGTNSQFFEIHKMEEPAFFYYYNQALSNVNIQSKKHILNLGINRGDEFEVIKSRLDENKYNNMQLVGIDHSKTAIEYAQNIFKEKNVKLYTQDINNLHTLNLGKFDLLISIGTLQSPSINFKPFFMNLVQNNLEKDSAIILGFPNSRWVGGEVLY
jgi:hypothetical protein